MTAELATITVTLPADVARDLYHELWVRMEQLDMYEADREHSARRSEALYNALRALEAQGIRECSHPGCSNAPQPGPLTGDTDRCPEHWGIGDRVEAAAQDAGNGG